MEKLLRTFSQRMVVLSCSVPPDSLSVHRRPQTKATDVRKGSHIHRRCFLLTCHLEFLDQELDSSSRVADGSRKLGTEKV